MRAGSRVLPAVVALVCAALVGLVCVACDSSSGASPTSPAATSPSVPPTTTTVTSTVTQSSPPTLGTPIGTDPGARVLTDSWGITSDGLLSVVVRNVGEATVRSARAIISARDRHDNLIAAVSAPAGTLLGTRCCTIISLAPGHSYGLFSDLGTRGERVAKVTVDYTSVRTDATQVQSPVLSMSHASLRRDGDQADVSVTVKMAKAVGPYITVQALLDGPDGKFLSVISSGFYCLRAGTERTIKLQLFHPVPAGSSVDSVISYPLDATTARIENLQRCSA